MVVDGVSWRILLEDLQSAYRQHQQGQPSQLPPRTTAFQQWAARLATYAQSASVQAELTYWLAPARRRVGRLPLDDPFGANTVADAAVVTLALSADETHALLRDLPQVYRTQINDALLAALALVARDWMGAPALLLDLEGHGREDIFADVDLTRTVGWFTTRYPVLLELPAGADAGSALKAVKEQLRAVPQHGLGYGLLRYLSPNAAQRAQLAALPQAELSFNYLGQIDQGVELAGLFAPAPEDSGPARSPRHSREYLLEINAFSAAGQLQVSWIYSRRHSGATIARWADAYMAALRQLIAHSRAPDSDSVTASDFPLAQLSQDELDELLGQVRFKEE
jgi:non-ribosomal peptide synthase protein (TIGR01720 family)